MLYEEKENKMEQTRVLFLVDFNKNLDKLYNLIKIEKNKNNEVFIVDTTNTNSHLCRNYADQYKIKVWKNYKFESSKNEFDIIINFNSEINDQNTLRKRKKSVKFSVIYKIGKENNLSKLKESFESILGSIFNQSINFDENVEILCIDEHYKKEVATLCNTYSSITYYPLYNNVQFFPKLQGEYVTIMGENDKLGRYILEDIYNVGDKNKEVTFFSVYTKFFGKHSIEKFNNYYFNKDFTIFTNTNREFWNIPLSLRGVFWRNKENLFINDIFDLSNLLRNNPIIGYLPSNKSAYYQFINNDIFEEYQNLEIVYNHMGKALSKGQKFQKSFLEHVVHSEPLRNITEIQERKEFQRLLNYYPYKLSVVMAVYNVEKFLGEAIESFVKQTIGFTNIQLILVNDGSTDGSEDICLTYKERYPYNILYIKQENIGVAEARNNGLKYAQGEFVTFTDSDDRLGLSTVQNVYNFMKKHPEIDLSAIRLRTFDAETGGHPLNYKFDQKNSRVTDLRKEYWNVQLSSSSSFVRRRAILENKFDKYLKYGEDAKFIHEICAKNPKIGLISFAEGCYFYRKRSDKSSAMQRTTRSIEWYLDTIDRFHLDIMDKSTELFTQYVVMYDLQWRLRVKPEILSKNQKIEYTNKLTNLLSRIDDEVILNPYLKAISARYKSSLISLKKGANYTIKGNALENNNNHILSLKDLKVSISVLEIKRNHLHIVMKLPSFEKNLLRISLILNNQIINPKSITSQNDVYFLENVLVSEDIYEFDIPLTSSEMIIKMKFSINNLGLPLSIIQGKFSRLSNDLKPFMTWGSYILTLEENKLRIHKNRSLAVKYQLMYAFKLMKNKDYAKVGITRFVHLLTEKFVKEKIWIFEDRLDKANDNAEALYKYVQQNPVKNVKSYFVIDKCSEDYKRLKSLGFNVVPYASRKYNMLMLRADKVITSHVDDAVLKPFGKKYNYYKDLLKFDLVFLQHGVTTEDMSNWLGKANKNIKLFITSGISESNSIVKYPYAYSRNEIALTGLPRHDYLNKNNKNYISIMPTWRPNLVKLEKNGKGKFEKSEYYIFFNKILTDKRLIELLRNKKMEIRFVQHPNMRKLFNKYFSSTDVVKVIDKVDYNQIISESNLLVTDRSSLFFDFAYLNKPIIYSHFDFENLINQSAYSRGYFDYQNDGFGKVTFDIENTLEELISIIKNDFVINDTHQERINNFFKYRDKNNCKRVIKHIISLD